MPGLGGFNQRPARHLRAVESVRVQPAPVKEWPLVMSADDVLAVCPMCGERRKVKTIGQAWAAAKSHNEKDH